MPQMQLPIFPAGAKEMSKNMAVQCKDGRVAYFHGQMPVFQHDEKSVKSFRFFTSQLVDAGAVKAREVAEGFEATRTAKRRDQTHQTKNPSAPCSWRLKSRRNSYWNKARMWRKWDAS